MLILDENISGLEEEKLLRWRIRCRCIGVELAANGTDDADLIPVLLALPRPTFFTHDTAWPDKPLSVWRTGRKEALQVKITNFSKCQP